VRIRLVQTARWVAYSRAQSVVDELERRYHYPSCARMPCLLSYGESGMGKTMILEKLERQHPSTLDERHDIKRHPVLTVQMPPGPDERRFHSRMLEVLIKESDGITGRVTALIGRAAEIAIADGREQIDAAGITRVGECQRVAAI